MNFLKIYSSKNKGRFFVFNKKEQHTFSKNDFGRLNRELPNFDKILIFLINYWFLKEIMTNATFQLANYVRLSNQKLCIDNREYLFHL